MNNTWADPPPDAVTDGVAAAFGCWLDSTVIGDLVREGVEAAMGAWLELGDHAAQAIPLNRHEAARIAAAGIHSYASRSDYPLSYDAMGQAAVDALASLGALSVMDVDAASEEARRRDDHHALDRDQAEVDAVRQDGAA